MASVKCPEHSQQPRLLQACPGSQQSSFGPVSPTSKKAVASQKCDAGPAHVRNEGWCSDAGLEGTPCSGVHRQPGGVRITTTRPGNMSATETCAALLTCARLPAMKTMKTPQLTQLSLAGMAPTGFMRCGCQLACCTLAGQAAHSAKEFPQGCAHSR
jgi:hypothetical protein